MNADALLEKCLVGTLDSQWSSQLFRYNSLKVFSIHSSHQAYRSSNTNLCVVSLLLHAWFIRCWHWNKIVPQLNIQLNTIVESVYSRSCTRCLYDTDNGTRCIPQFYSMQILIQNKFALKHVLFVQCWKLGLRWMSQLKICILS